MSNLSVPALTFFFLSSRRRHTRFRCDWSSDVCSFFFQAEDGIRDSSVTGVQTCALPICLAAVQAYGLDVSLQPFKSQVQDGLGRIGHGKQLARGLVHAHVRGLGDRKSVV